MLEQSTPTSVPRQTATTTPYLRAEDIVKRFGDFTALRDVSLDVQQGRFVTILGPSGCGKTTLLRVIAGLESHDCGRVILDGRDISHRPPSQRRCGLVFQSYALFPNLSAEKNIAFGMSRQQLPRQQRRQRITELLEMVGLPDAAGKYPAQLSGGQQQRVALARALAMSPALLLLDEPLSALDARVRVRLRREIRSLQQSLGLTTVMVTHDQDEALTMADDIVVMDHGCIVQVGSPREIYEKPAHPFVADFVGHMNFIHGWRLDDGGALRRGGLRLRCEDAAIYSGGENLTLAVRPEELALTAQETPVEATTPDLSQVNLPATVNAVEFRGSVTRYYLSLNGSDARHESERRDDLTVDVTPQEAARLNIQRDQRVFAALHADRVHVFAQA